MLKLKEVRKSYHHNQGLVRVNMTIKPGNIYLLVGENGSGKSTTIKLLSKVIFNKHQDGEILNEFKKIVYLPDKRNYPKLLNVSTFLKYFLGDKSMNQTIMTYLERYNVPNKNIGYLSKGMLQKVGIIQSLLSQGDLFLFDEPTDGLDLDSIKLFKDDLLKMLDENKTIIISTHSKQLFKDLKPIIYNFKEGVCDDKTKAA